MTLIDGDRLADTFKDKLCDHLYCRDCPFQLEDGGCKVEKWLDETPIAEQTEPSTEEKAECPFDDKIPCEWVCPNSTDCSWK